MRFQVKTSLKRLNLVINLRIEFLRIRVEKYFIQYAFPQVRQSTKIKIAELGNDAGIIGAASLASQFLD